MLTNIQLEHILVGSKIFSPADVEKYTATATGKDQTLEEYLLGDRLLSEDNLYETAATFFNLPFVNNIKHQMIRPDVLALVPEPLAQHYQIVAYDTDNDGSLKVVTTDPENLQALEFLKKKTGREILVSLSTPTTVKDLLKQYHKSLQAEFRSLTGVERSGQEEMSDMRGLKALAEDLPVIRIVDTLLEYAIFEGASDIHIEPEEAQIDIRYRIDGILRSVMTLPKPVHSGVIARIKVLSNLKLDEHRLPQDGRFKIQTNEYNIAFRVSILPTFDGEKVVLRLLNESGQVRPLEQMDMQPGPFAVLAANIKKPHGMLLVTGPTGSGKTTTLYTILNVLNRPEVNISTIEDPIEYRMPHVNQSQVNPKIGYTFASGLRALLRQDPNIIMVGEIRDNETAAIAVNAAMTGHLLLSTLHTNDAVTAIPRLMDMGIQPFLVASTTNMVMAQRLVRKICPYCIASFNLDQAVLKELDAQFDLHAILSMLISQGSIAKATKSFETLLFYRGKGCKHCGGEGYHGRTGIYEVLDVTTAVGEAIVRKATGQELLAIARSEGMLTMVEDGFLKAKSGITTIEEVLRVTQE